MIEAQVTDIDLARNLPKHTPSALVYSDAISEILSADPPQ
ncbi:MAG: hypothetical protein ACI9UN_000713 [Granulosicoccus sp.]|jgi:hypothetical protein